MSADRVSADNSAPATVMDAFWEYERALMADDLDALDRLFAPGPQTLRGDAGGLLVGHDAISEFRSARGGAPERRIVETHVQQIDDDHALVVAVTELLTGGRGQQTQLWERRAGTWVVTAAHVSTGAPAFDRRVWRVVGDPLVPASGPGPLDGQSVAVKDLYAVGGQRIGAGNPAWLARAPVEPRDAWAVARLRSVGAVIRGLARTDELAYSLAGTNAHYGTPPNPRAPHRISGGSTSGSASAVSLGHASIALGTDTGGSVRVPGAYQGLWGIRTTHGAVPRDGLVPLAPTFDTVGWLTRDAALLADVASVLLPEDAAVPGDLVVADDLLALADDDVAEAVRPLAASATTTQWPTDAMAGWLAAFQTLQAAEAWQSHGHWFAQLGEVGLDVLGADVRARFARARSVTDDEAAAARSVVDAARAEIRDRLAGRTLVLPSTSSVAPRIVDAGGIDRIRQATMTLTCLAGIGGLPAVTVPMSTRDALPAGACLVGAAGSDQALVAVAAELARSVSPTP